MSRRGVALLILLAGLLVYPAVVSLGGAPRFPNVGECVRPATATSEVEAVFGRFRDRAAAVALRDRALAVGFKETEVTRDGCGFIRVALSRIPSLAVGLQFAKEARRAGFIVTLERPAQ